MMASVRSGRQGTPATTAATGTAPARRPGTGSGGGDLAVPGRRRPRAPCRRALLPTTAAAAAIALGIGAAGCGGPAHGLAAGNDGSAASSALAHSPARVRAAVTATWTAFFNPRTPEAEQISLLQDGSRYKNLVDTIRDLMPEGTTAKVTGVQLSGHQAKVTYQILDKGQKLVPRKGDEATGTAVEHDGEWKVSDVTFCELVSLTGTSCKS